MSGSVGLSTNALGRIVSLPDAMETLRRIPASAR
jgi:hypothetical protein